MKLSRKREIEQHEPLAAVTVTETPSRPWSLVDGIFDGRLCSIRSHCGGLLEPPHDRDMRVQILAEGAKPQPHINTDEEIF